jgi:FkbM family methyltransferase
MNKIELLKKLDEVVHFSNELTNFQELLGDSKQVHVIVSSSCIDVHQLETGAKFHWNLSDPRTAVACLAIAGEYEPRETDLVRKISKHCKSVIDVGAIVGYYAVNIPLMSPEVQCLYAFEPLPEVYEQLCKNIQINGIENRVKHFNFAVSNNNLNLELHVPQVFGSSATSSVALHPEVTNKKVVVKSITLDELLHEGIVEACDFLKIDVEGAEKFVLEGANTLLAQEQPVILAEILRKWSHAQGYHASDILTLLKSFGYKCYAIGENLLEIAEISDDLLETNFLFLNIENLHHGIIAAELGIPQ